MHKKSAKGWEKHWDFIVLDLVIVELSLWIAYIIRHQNASMYENQIYRSLAVEVLMVDLVVAIVLNSFSGVLKRGLFKLFIDTFKHCVTTLSINVFLLFAMQASSGFSRIVITLTSAFHFVLGYLMRIGYGAIVKRRYAGCRPLFLITTKDRAEKLVHDIMDTPAGSTVNISGIAIVDESCKGLKIGGIEVVADEGDVLDYVTKHWVEEIYLSLPRENPLNSSLYATLMVMGLTVHMDIGVLNVYENQRQEVRKIGSTVVLSATVNTISGWNLMLKRLADIIGGFIGSVLALIIMAVVAIPLKIASPGPVLYASERVGLNGKRFKMYKIRSMYPDADARKASLMSQNKIKSGMMFKLDFDPRIIGNKILPDGTTKTGLGQFLRRTSLDEFPQFFNVLAGSMSLVGTRPPTPDEVEKYKYHYRSRLSTVPGVTGLWQISGRSEIVDFDEVVKLDDEYIGNWSVGLDIKIILKTIVAVVKGRGAM